MNRDHSEIVFEIASKYCISDSFVDYEGYSISSKGFCDPSHIQNATTTITTLKPNNQLLLMDRGRVQGPVLIVGQEPLIGSTCPASPPGVILITAFNVC